MSNSWTYPISGNIYHFPDREGDASFTSETHYFTKAKPKSDANGGYSPSGCLRSMALFIDGLGESDSVESISVYPEFRDGVIETTWAGMVTVYHDKAGAGVSTLGKREAA